MSPIRFTTNPSATLGTAFEAIFRERMAGIPLINPALHVEAVGFDRTSHGWLGVLVTPLFMNLMLLPAAGAAWVPLGLGEKRVVSLPAGSFEFFGGFEDAVGEYQYCSMFSPMSRFADHETALATAREIARMIFDAGVGEQVREMNPTGLKWFEAEKPQPAQAAESAAPEVSESKRAFLRGRFGRSGK